MYQQWIQHTLDLRSHKPDITLVSLYYKRHLIFTNWYLTLSIKYYCYYYYLTQPIQSQIHTKHKVIPIV